MITINKEPHITVGIVSDERLKFELYGEFKAEGIEQTLSGRFIAELKDGKIICTREGENYEFKDQVLFKPLDPDTSFLLRDVMIGLKFHWERKEKQRFFGALKLVKEENHILAINILPLEKYLTSVISSEMSSKSSIELLKAHAIISRSWLLAQLERGKDSKKKKPALFKESETEHIKWYDREEHKQFDVCADDHCQRYQGITKIYSDAALKAIEQTYGLVLVNEHSICDTRYSKSCGGITECYENVWEPVKYNYLKNIVDYKYEHENYNLDFTKEVNAIKWIKGNPPAFCNTSDKKILSHVLLDYDQETNDFYRWKVAYSQEELAEIIRSKSGLDFGDIIDLIPVERGKSARIIKLKITGTKKTLIVGKELEIRKFLAKTHLYSSAFTIEKKNIKQNIPEKFIIYGAGWGHGVGLCQIGAALMAANGYFFDEILGHYFLKANLKKIY